MRNNQITHLNSIWEISHNNIMSFWLQYFEGKTIHQFLNLLRIRYEHVSEKDNYVE